jgi:hypothetical protein
VAGFQSTKGDFVTLPHGRGSVSGLESTGVSEPRP